MAVAGVGIDAVDVARLAAAMRRTPRIAERVFTERERADGREDAQRLAGRFAAKEATMKALGTGLGAFSFHDVEVVREKSGAPTLRLRRAAAELAERRGVACWHLSITHTDEVAIAMVVAEGAACSPS